MKWRDIGPFRGGRVLAVTGVPGSPFTYYFGGVGGGVWRTTDGGVSWQPLSDKGMISSIGAIAVSESNPNVIYVGTGESCLRGNISYGDGVYKSTDGGKTWQHIGLKDTQHIARVWIDPPKFRPCFDRGAWPRLRPELGAWRLPHHRWRQNLG